MERPIRKSKPNEESGTLSETLRGKIVDAMTPGYEVEFDPDEAEQAGAFVEDALTERDAAESSIDSLDFPTSAVRG